MSAQPETKPGLSEDAAGIRETSETDPGSAAEAQEPKAGANAVHERWRALEDEFAQPVLEDFQAATPAEACLRPLLQALGWHGVHRHVFEAMPHFDHITDISGLRAVLARLNYHTKARKAVALSRIEDEQLPCLFVPEEDAGQNVQILVGRNEDQTLLVYDGGNAEFVSLNADHRRGTVYLINQIDREEEQAEIAKSGWLFHAVGKFRRLLTLLFFVSLMINIFALAVPIFVMGVYDKAIGARAPEILFVFAMGISLILLTDLMLKRIRAKAQSFFGARIDSLIATNAFQQLLNMPIAMTEGAAIGSQITRLRQLEGIRNAFTGPLASAIVDLPFVALFLVVIALIGGNLVWVPTSLILAYTVLGVITIPMSKRQVARSGEAKTKNDNFLIEALRNQRTISDLSEEERWVNKFRQLSFRFTKQNDQTRFLNFAVQTISQSFMTLAGVATLGIGTIMVLDGTLSAGGLIAVMALVWRVLAPLQQTFLSLGRLGQILSSFQQINRLMRIRLERKPGVLSSFYRSFTGALSILQLSFRYPGRQEPALRGVQLIIQPGEVVAIAGPSGAGKTTLLNVINGLYESQGGAVFIDGVDIRQLEPGEWRHAIGYAPETSTLFYGTMAQNLRLAHPSATAEELERAVSDAGVGDYHEHLPDWLETRLSGPVLARMPDGLKKRIVLARAYVKDAPLYLFDNPGDNLDRAGDMAFLKKLESLRGKSTVVFTTHRPSHMRAADRLIYMMGGQIALEGAPDEVLEKLEAAKKA